MVGIVLIQDMRPLLKFTHSFLGLADPNENIYESASREVREETGVDCEGTAVLSFRYVSLFHMRMHSYEY